MELMALREALSRAPLGADLEILTDSGNAVGWLAGRWKRNKPILAALGWEIELLAAKRSGKGHLQARQRPPGRYPESAG
jgi:ribonuclease HI